MKAGTCTTTCKVVSGSIVQSHVDVTAKSDQAMMEALAKQPVSVAIEADQKEFQLYKSGVFTAACGTNLDHGVLVVGYGTDTTSGLNFYKVKNSWGTTWGQNGYILLARGGSYNNGAGQCGVLMESSYPVL
jgi:C1A family cysteine protease